MNITSYLHSAVLVSDLAKAEHFYGTILGLPRIDRNLRFPGAWYQIGAAQLHLIAVEGTGADRIIADRVDPEKWGRNRHLA